MPADSNHFHCVLDRLWEVEDVLSRPTVEYAGEFALESVRDWLIQVVNDGRALMEKSIDSIF